ncbi:hypothetical protein [Actinomadura sp. 9N407]|uniref:hypothetical protein n=1 Tax=Actinomadura sp. 9N407 TaxID=3375154 RepID=UPI0037B5535B
MTASGHIHRPPFAFRVEVPDDWTVFDTAPETWRHSAKALVSGGELTPAQRRGAMRILQDVAESAQLVGVCVSAVKLARDRERRIFWGTLSLTWYDSKPIEPDLAFLEIVVGKRDRRQIFECDLAAGLIIRGRTVWADPLPGIMTEGRTYDTQIYLPMPGTTWTALFSGSTAAAAHADLMEKLVRRMALSLKPDLPVRNPKSGPERISEGADALRERLRSATHGDKRS